MMTHTIRDRCWLWGMKVNALQITSDYRPLGFGDSTLTVEQAIGQTGITNVFVAGRLPITDETIASMPSARRLVCKTALHNHAPGLTLEFDRAIDTLMAAKRLALCDPRIDGFHVDDFSTGTVEAGITPEHLARLQWINALHAPHLPLGATIYTLSLECPKLPGLLPYFDRFVVPLWHADQIEGVPGSVARLGALSGGKPMLLCLYCYDFGNSRPMPAALMRRHLEVAEELIRAGQVTGMMLCGTCMMDLDWEANAVYFDWLARVGDQPVGA